jgi:hypothetical protein
METDNKTDRDNNECEKLKLHRFFHIFHLFLIQCQYDKEMTHKERSSN